MAVPEEPAAPPRVNVDAGAELVYERLDTIESRDGWPAPNEVVLARRVIFIQGFLLGAVALVFFIFGVIVGTRSARNVSSGGAGGPCTVSGRVLLTVSAGGRAPDRGSVVCLLPVETRPDTKVEAEQLSPDAPPLLADHVAVAAVRQLGGDYARVDTAGQFHLRVPSKGRYFLLVISNGATRRSDEHPKAHDLAQIGRYFVPALELLGDHRYQWKELLLRDDRRLEVTF